LHGTKNTIIILVGIFFVDTTIGAYMWVVVVFGNSGRLPYVAHTKSINGLTTYIHIRLFIVLSITTHNHFMSGATTNTIDTYANKGLTGLVNMGNTCFVNTCLQMLSHTYELNDIMDKDGFSTQLNRSKPDSILMNEWDTLRKIMWKQNCIVEPGKFIHTIQQVAKVKGVELFTGFSQNDISEFLLFIIDCFHTSIARPVNIHVNGKAYTDTDQIAVKVYSKIKEMYSSEYSEVWNLFYGMHISQLVSCKTGKVLSHIPEPFFTVSLSIPRGKVVTSLYDCFDYYVTGERLEGENGRRDEKTNKREDVIKNLTYWSLPTILCIDLKRFDASNKKNQQMVSFPLTDLDMRKYVIGYQKESYHYDLYGVCNHHSGSAQGGHYTGSIKNANGKWYEFDDSSIGAIANATDIITPRAYCLFYRKRGTYTTT
jgi:ubiquitin carboxyl-terminal hydrolase 8